MWSWENTNIFFLYFHENLCVFRTTRSNFLYFWIIVMAFLCSWNVLAVHIRMRWKQNPFHLPNIIKVKLVVSRDHKILGNVIFEPRYNEFIKLTKSFSFSIWFALCQQGVWKKQQARRQGISLEIEYQHKYGWGSTCFSTFHHKHDFSSFWRWGKTNSMNKSCAPYNAACWESEKLFGVYPGPQPFFFGVRALFLLKFCYFSLQSEVIELIAVVKFTRKVH